MSDMITLRFESKLQAPIDRVWEWITSLKGISAEMWPFFRMTAPKGVSSLNDVEIKPGVRMFRSYVFLFGVLPIDYSDMTLLELNVGEGFTEQSPMGSMKLWRHERRIVPCPSDSNAVLLVDQLTFQPRMARRIVGWFIRRVFIHRHAVLKANLGGAQSGSRGFFSPSPHNIRRRINAMAGQAPHAGLLRLAQDKLTRRFTESIPPLGGSNECSPTVL